MNIYKIFMLGTVYTEAQFNAWVVSSNKHLVCEIFNCDFLIEEF